jgi:hypothetical protein
MMFRRNVHRGLWTVHTLNKGVPGRDVDVFLLDERYNRSPLPCYVSVCMYVYQLLP